MPWYLGEGGLLVAGAAVYAVSFESSTSLILDFLDFLCCDFGGE